MRLPSMPAHHPPLLVVTLAAGVLLGACVEESTATQTSAPAVSTSVTIHEPATHTVVRGETLSTIARDTGVPVAMLAELNGIENPDRIEVGLVLLLEARGVAEPVAPRAVAPAAPVADPLVAWIDERWESIRPHLTLSERAVEQGAVAGMLLPAVVIGLVFVGVVVSRTRRLVSDAARRATGRRAPHVESGDAQRSRGDSPSEVARARLRPRRPSVRVPRLAVSRWWPWGGAQTVGGASRRMVRAVATRGGRTVARGLGGASRVLVTRVRRSNEVRSQRRRQLSEQQRQAELRARWWRAGMEALRIGLLEEAERCFSSGLEAARIEGWRDEVALFEESLRRVHDRRSSEVLSPSR